MQMALIIIPGKILLTAHLYLSIVSTYQSAMLTFPRIKEQSITLKLSSMTSTETSVYSRILRRSPQKIKKTFFPLDPCWLPVKLILKQENKIFVGIYLKLWAGQGECQTNPPYHTKDILSRQPISSSRVSVQGGTSGHGPDLSLVTRFIKVLSLVNIESMFT